MSLLFILKKRHGYSGETLVEMKSGLYNSANHVAGMLKENGIPAKLVEVTDGNCIDREVTRNRPGVVILEALWVTPDKLSELVRLHPGVSWVVRLHSNTPFLANEGIAMDWVSRYATIPNVFVSGNHINMMADLSAMIGDDKIIYLPNVYNLNNTKIPFFSVLWDARERQTINVGCFGAIRPMKNHLQQAIASIQFANDHNVQLKFSINSSRIENNGSNVLKNIRALFDHQPNHRLIEHGWMDNDRFKRVIKQQDICIQASLSETFNIVTADAVACGVPVVVSDQISWIPKSFRADPTSPFDIRDKIESALLCSTGPYRNHRALRRVSGDHADWWIRQFRGYRAAP